MHFTASSLASTWRCYRIFLKILNYSNSEKCKCGTWVTEAFVGIPKQRSNCVGQAVPMKMLVFILTQPLCVYHRLHQCWSPVYYSLTLRAWKWRGSWWMLTKQGASHNFKLGMQITFLHYIIRLYFKFIWNAYILFMTRSKSSLFSALPQPLPGSMREKFHVSQCTDVIWALWHWGQNGLFNETFRTSSFGAKIPVTPGIAMTKLSSHLSWSPMWS